MYSVAIFLQRDTRDRSQQCLPNSSLAKLRTYEKILEKQTGPRPCRIISKEKSVPRRLLIPLGNQRAKFGVQPKAIPCKVRLFDHAEIQFAFKVRQFADHCSEQGHVIDRCGTNQEHQHEEYISSGCRELEAHSAPASVRRQDRSCLTGHT